MQVVVDSLLTSYQRFDAQPGLRKAGPVLLLHGWGDNSRGWRDFAGRLGMEIYVVDLPGFGGTDMPPQPWGLDEYADFAGHFLEKVDVRPRAIIGHSNGGAIAVRGLADGSLKAEKLVLLASAGVRSEYKGRNKVVRMVAKTGKLLAMPLPKPVKEKLRRKLYTSVGSDMLVAEHLQETFKRVVNDDVQQDAARLKLPTLLVYGDRDVSTPPRFGRMLHEKISGSEFKVIDAEHFVHLDRPEEVSALVKEFLA